MVTIHRLRIAGVEILEFSLETQRSRLLKIKTEDSVH